MRQPKLLAKIWAAIGLKNTIPESRGSGLAQGAATYDEGFPSITMTPIAQGGKAPSGKDMNGILHELSAHIVHMNQGGHYKFDSGFAEKINGYNKGAVLINNDETAFFVSLVDQNKTDFNSGSDYADYWIKLADVEAIKQITPKDLTEESVSEKDHTGHTHRLPFASLIKKGIAKLYSGLDSNAEDMAATPRAIKRLKDLIDANIRNFGNFIANSKKSNAINSPSSDTVATSFAVKTAHDKAVNALDVANSKLGPIGTYTGNKSSLYGQNIIFDVRNNNNLGLPSEAYPWGVGLSLSSLNGGKALLYIAHNASQVWAKGIYGTDDSQPWRRIDGTDWGAIRNPVYASTTLRGLAQYSDAIYLDSGDFAASSRAVKLLNDKKVDKLIEQTLDLKSLRQDKWYPVILKLPNMRQLNYFEVRTTLGDGNKPTWANHAGGISLFCQWDTQHAGWGTYDINVGMREIKKFEYLHCNQSPMLKIGQLFQPGYEYFYLRGGASYTLYREAGVAVEIATSPNGYHWQNEDGQYRQHLPLIESYDESLVPMTTKQELSTVSRRDYSRTVRGTNANWDNGTSKSIAVTGSVEIYPDGKIVQYFYYRNFRVHWFDYEIAPPDHFRVPEIPIQLWTAMPNKITYVSGHISRTNDTSIWPVRSVGAEASEWTTPLWAFEKQGNLKDRCSVYTRRLAGDTNETVDMLIRVEGY